MKYLTFAVIIGILLSGCASTPLEKKRKETIDCVKDLMGNDAETLDAFAVCRQVYKMKLVKEYKQ